MKTTISKSWSFDAAHQLPHHDGKCANPHGHTYRLTVGVSGEPKPIKGNPDEGMVMDFAVLDDVWKLLKPILDHRDLNALTRKRKADPLRVPVTTSEQLAAMIFNVFDREIRDRGLFEENGAKVEFVRLSETGATYAEVKR